MRKLITNCFVVSVDPEIGNIENADILIEDGRIAEIRPGIEAEADEVIDAAGHIASPGFVDAHHHLWQSAMRGLTADWSLLDYVAGIRMNAAALYRADDMYAANLHGSLEALNAGVTTVADYCHNLLTPDHAEEALRGVQDAGIRAVWCYGFNTPPLEDPAFPDTASRVSFFQEIAGKRFASKDQLVTLGLSPEEIPMWQGDTERGKAQFRAARDHGARIFLHTNSANDPLTGDAARDADALNRMKLLGPDLVLVHMGWSEADEWAAVADSGTSLAFTPETEIQMGMNAPSIRVATEKKIPFAFGTDIISNNSPDLRIALRLALQVERFRMQMAAGQHGLGMQGTGIEITEALEWGTIGGARVLGLDHKIGSLTPGKSADILLHDMTGPTMVGWDRSNPAGSLLLQGGPESLAAVLVEGEFRKRDFQTAGMGQANARLKASSEHVFDQIAEMGGPKRMLESGYQKMMAVLGEAANA